MGRYKFGCTLLLRCNFDDFLGSFSRELAGASNDDIPGCHRRGEQGNHKLAL